MTGAMGVRWFGVPTATVVAIVVTAGLTIGGLLFLLTAQHPADTWDTNVCRCSMTSDGPGFDPWTGQPHGILINVTDGDGAGQTFAGTPPDDLVGRWAIPIPLGALAGAVFTLAALRIGAAIGVNRRLAGAGTEGG